MSDSLLVLGFVYPGNFGLAVFGDTDHDGFQEMFSSVSDFETTSLRAVEERGDGVYHDAHSLETSFAPYVIGDLDLDGKSEIVGQIDDRIEILESQNPISHPTVASWSSPPLSNIVGYSNVRDTDRDGKMEIIHSINPSRLIIFENQGDNTFVEKYFDAGPFQDQGRKLIADFDADGLLEIAISGHRGNVLVYESPDDDIWIRTFKDSTGLDNAYGIGGGVDSDGNGLLELFIVGDGWVEGLGRRVRTILVYESACDNCFEIVATMEFDDGHIGGLYDAVTTTNLDNVGHHEIVLSVFRQLNVYRAVAPGQWAMTVGAIDPNQNGIHVAAYGYDANKNGLPEIFWVPHTNINQSSLVLEHPGVSPSDATPQTVSQPGRFVVVPNPARSYTEIVLARSVDAARSLAVFDASGRLVDRQPLPHQALHCFRWLSPPTRPGMYFLRLEDAAGQSLMTGRATIVR